MRTATTPLIIRKVRQNTNTVRETPYCATAAAAAAQLRIRSGHRSRLTITAQIAEKAQIAENDNGADRRKD
eukprot:scaffold643550_cov19-Prasinocladus_malaysianus.AAC.1